MEDQSDISDGANPSHAALSAGTRPRLSPLLALVAAEHFCPPLAQAGGRVCNFRPTRLRPAQTRRRAHSAPGNPKERQSSRSQGIYCCIER